MYNRLLEKNDYRFDATLQEFKPVYQEVNTYNKTAEAYLDYVYGNEYIPEAFQQNPIDGFAAGNWLISPTFYGKPSYLGVSLPESKTITETNLNGTSMITTEYYGYNNRNQLNAKSFTGSRAEGIANIFTYPATGMGSVINDMVTKNIISPVIETTANVGYLSGNTTVASSKVEFGKFGSSQIILPAKSYQLEKKTTGDIYTLQAEVKSYSANGNPLEVVTKDNQYSSYIWGYDDRYMIADAKNAPANQIAYTSFEDLPVNLDASKNWAGTGTLTEPVASLVPPTGKKFYNLTNANPLTRTVINGKIYIVSYWRNNTSPFTLSGVTATPLTGSTSPVIGSTINGWTYFEHRVTANSTTISLSGLGGIDEVRLYPANAQMVSSTYDPLIGISSQSDPNGKITYYEYDPFGRLMHLKDQNGNIIKKICYNYAGQPMQCYGPTYANSVGYSGNFTRNNCAAGFAGSTVNYLIPANTVTSYTSVADANSLAQQKMQAEGQAYANANGTCTPIATCTFANCGTNGVQFKCIDGTCYEGFAVYYGLNPYNNNECMWRYEWWDGSYSVWNYQPSYGFDCLMSN